MSNEKDFYCPVFEEETEVDHIARSWARRHGFSTRDNEMPRVGKRSASEEEKVLCGLSKSEDEPVIGMTNENF